MAFTVVEEICEFVPLTIRDDDSGRRDLRLVSPFREQPDGGRTPLRRSQISGDGLEDLVVGEKTAGALYYKNVGNSTTAL